MSNCPDQRKKCKIDYFNHAVKLRYWFRCIPRVRDTGRLKGFLQALNVTMQPVADLVPLENVLEKNRLYLGVQHRGRFSFIAFPAEVVHDAVSAYHITNHLQNRRLHEGDQLEYIPKPGSSKERPLGIPHTRS